MTLATALRSLADQRKLESLGFPFDEPEQRAVWARSCLASEQIKRTYQSESLADGWTLARVADGAGISVDRTLHHLAKAPDEWEAHGWETPFDARGVVVDRTS
jgi:hypothetical protein